MPGVTRSIALAKLQESLDSLEDLQTAEAFWGVSLRRWWRDTAITIEYVFGKQSRHVYEFRDINFGPLFSSSLISRELTHELQNQRIDELMKLEFALKEAELSIDSFCREIGEF